jgi:hypothetical protein
MELYFDLDKVNIDKALSETAIKAAWRRTLNKFARHISAKVAKTLAPQADVTQRAIKQRLKTFQRRNSGFAQVKLWLGLNPLAAHHVGTLRQLKGTGVKVRGHHLPKSFLAKGQNTGKTMAFERSTQSRYPIKISRIEWSESAEQAFQNAMLGAQPELMRRYQQELNYELLKATGQL